MIDDIYDIATEFFERFDKYRIFDPGQNRPLDTNKIQSDMIVIKEKITNIISKSDKIDLLSKISTREFFYPLRKYDRFVELGGFAFVIGLALNDINISGENKKKQEGEYDELCDYVVEYIDLFEFETMASSLSKDITISNLNFITQSYNLLNKVNYGGYQSQYNEYANSVYLPLFPLFNNLGLTPADVISFSKRIRDEINSRIRKLMHVDNDSINFNNQTPRENRKKIETSFDMNHSISTYLKELNNNITNVLVFKPKEIISEDDVNYSKFLIYLNLISCKFGDHNNKFLGPNDHNTICDQPIINLQNGNYFCPKPDLLTNDHLILENIIRSNYDKLAPSIQNKLNKNKKNYTENKPTELLKSIFPKEAVFKNLYYYKGSQKSNRMELDNVVLYDNFVILFESKSGSLTEPGLRGGVIRFKDDIQDIVKKGDSQLNGVIEYIKSTENPTFYNENAKEVLKISLPTNKLKLIKVVLTFVPFRGLIFNREDFAYLNLFAKDKCLVISIFDLERIVKSLPIPTMMIDYLEKRVDLMNQEIGQIYLGEIPLLYEYMTHLNFDNANMLSLMDQKRFDQFDNFYEARENRIQTPIHNNLVNMLERVEKSRSSGFTEICSALINLNSETKNELVKKFTKGKKDLKGHKKSKSFSYRSQYHNYGLTFLITKDMSNPAFIDECKVNKNMHKTDKWYGLNYVTSTDSIEQIVILGEL